MQRLSAFSVLFLLLVSACSAATSTTTNPAPTSTTAEPTTTTALASTTSRATPSTSTATSTTTTDTTITTTTTTTTSGPTTTTLAGAPFDLGPPAGAVLAVVGVAFDDVLNVRSGPGTNQPIVARLNPLYDHIVATGQHRLLTRSIWNEVTVDGITGWASSAFMAYAGVVTDATSRYVADAFGGAIPTARTMLELGMLVADAARSDDPPSQVTVTVAPSSGDPGEISIDVIGLGDDALFGIRLHVFGTAVTDGFSLKSVEEQDLCGRGIDADGLCP